MAVGLSAFVTAGAPTATGAPRPVAPFATGGPDTFGYRFIDSQEANGPSYSALFEDITSQGSQVFGANVDDSVSGVISIGFSFPFYGTNYSSLYVSSNGNVHFTSPNASLGNTAIPNSGAPNAMIAPFWDDNHTRSGQIRSAMLGTAPNRRFIVHWINTGHFSSASDVYNYQVKLYEDGRMFFVYNSMSGTYANGNSATIGIENESGSIGLQYANSASPNPIANQRAIQFANNSTPADPTQLHQTGTTGGTARAVGFVSDSTIYFRATVSDPDAGNTLGLQAEILPSTSPFTSNPSGTLVSTTSANLVTDGQVAEALLDFTTVGLPSGNYHWRARTFDSAGAFSAWVVFDASTVHFTTDFVPPSVPPGPYTPDGVQLIFPTVASDVNFSWGGSTDAGPPGPIGYRIEISANSTFASTVYDSIVASQAITVNLSAMDTPYHWRVSAVDQAGNASAPSTPAIFQLSWTLPEGSGEKDRHANCGATTGSGSPLVMGLAILAGLLGLASMGRRS